MKPCLNSRKNRRPIARGPAYDSSENYQFSPFGRQIAYDLPPNTRAEIILLSMISAIISLLSSLFVGPSIALSAGRSIDHSIGGLWLPGGRQAMTVLDSNRSERDATPSIQLATAMFHVFCLSTLVLCRSRKADSYQITIITLVMLLGISLNLFLMSKNSYIDVVAKTISILPCLLSLGAILSSCLHSSLPLFYGILWSEARMSWSKNWG
ncbi:hypothetical protein F4680DRAFT_411277 [Xylaria scruposa]|nr:hypothetical protein F4680DRAFT_411277 [Xylaria scruposa]